MTFVINMHKPYFIFKTYVMSLLWWRRHVSLMHIPSSKVLPSFLDRSHSVKLHSLSQLDIEVCGLVGKLCFLSGLPHF